MDVSKFTNNWGAALKSVTWLSPFSNAKLTHNKQTDLPSVCMEVSNNSRRLSKEVEGPVSQKVEYDSLPEIHTEIL